MKKGHLLILTVIWSFHPGILAQQSQVLQGKERMQQDAPGQTTGPARIWVESQEIPTYLVDAPDKIPRFYEGRAYQGAQGRIYPYPIYESLSDTRVKEAYDVVCLENEYIKLELLPRIGGRLFSALDKTNGYDFIYKQHVIKPALIGMLGAWISGGIEWNFPHHHRATAFMPVDYVMQENEDGSSTVWIGELEIRHRMKFMLGVTVYPGRSYFEVTFRPYNRTPFVHSFLYFANTGVHTSEEYQVIFPPATQFGTYHGKNQFISWPISHGIYNRVDYTGGVDVSWWKNHPEWTSIFCWNYEDDFVGGYDHGKEAGILLFSNHHIAPGKKFWTWSTGPRGQMWDEALTESDGPELELMIGGYSDNQPDYSWIQPYESKFLRQYFYPIREIGPVKNANLEAAVNLELDTVPAGNRNRQPVARVGFNATSERKGAVVRLRIGEKVLFTQSIDIDPSHPFIKEIPVPAGTHETDLAVVLVSREGEELISYTPVMPEESEMPEVAVPPAPPREIETVEELCLAGQRLEQFYNPSFDPEPYYQEALKRDPENYRVHTAYGLMKLRNGLFEEAEDHLQRAVNRITGNHTKARDGEAYYYLGLSQRFLGKNKEAYDNLYWATWSQAFHSAAYYQLAELACMEGNYGGAMEYLNRSLATNAHHTGASNLKAALLRTMGLYERAVILASETYQYDPLDFWSMCESCFCLEAIGDSVGSARVKKILKERAHGYVQTYLELAIDYANAGFWEEAIRVLEEIYLEGDTDREAFPMTYYFLGYFWLNKGDKETALAYFTQAAEQSSDYCFPFRLESIGILKQASGLNPGDPKSPFYLGNLLYDHQPEAATKAWERSVALDDGFWLTHRNLGMAYNRAEQDKSRAIEQYRKAISLKPDDQRLLYELDLISAAGREDPESRLQLLKEHYRVISDNNVCDALSREVMLLVQLERYEEALSVMEENRFKQWEGINKAYNSYVDAHLFLGLELMRAGDYQAALKHMESAGKFPENMMVAKPYRGGRTGQVHYFKGRLYDAMGDPERAESEYEICVQERVSLGLDEYHYFRALAQKELGREEAAGETFDRLIELGERRLQSGETDFFAKFGEKETAEDRLADAYYLMGLGYRGKGMDEKASRMFSEAVSLNINHVWAHKLLSGALDRETAGSKADL